MFGCFPGIFPVGVPWMSPYLPQPSSMAPPLNTPPPLNVLIGTRQHGGGGGSGGGDRGAGGAEFDGGRRRPDEVIY